MPPSAPSSAPPRPTAPQCSIPLASCCQPNDPGRPWPGRGEQLLAAGMGVWTSLSISRRLGRTIRLADAVAAGDLGQTIAVSGNDEIKDLIDSLNSMTATLRD